MNKLLIVTTIERTIRAFLFPYGDFFRALGWRVDCISNPSEREFYECSDHFDNVFHISWSRNPFDVKNFCAPVKQIRELAENEQYDIVHVHTPVAAFVTRFALRNLRKQGKVKVVYTAHGFHFYKGGPMVKNVLFLLAEKIAARWTDHLIVINKEDYNAAVKWLLPKEKVTYMAGGIGLDLKKYDRSKITDKEIADVRKEMGLQDGDSLFLMIAEFNPGKRHRDAIKALALTHNKNIHIAFAGVGGLLEDMKNLAKEYSVYERTHFLEYRNDINTLIAASKGTILPSEREGLPRSVMESIVLGVPVIGADTRGIRDLVTDGAGIIVPVGDVEAIACALDKMAHKKRSDNAVLEILREKNLLFDDRIVLEKNYIIYCKLLNI